MDNITKLMNPDKYKFISIMGINASGKLELANKFKESGFILISPYNLNYMSCKDKNMQINNSIIKNLSNNKSIVFYDNQTTIKSRKKILNVTNQFNIKPIAIYLESPLDIAINRNLTRIENDNYIPNHVIEMEYEKQVLPTIKEGFKDVYIIHENLNYRKQENIMNTLENIKLDLKNNLTKGLFINLDNCINIDQSNENHNLSLYDHMINTAINLKDESLELFTAGLLHDIGKLKTKKQHGKLLVDTLQFKKNEKVEIKNIKDKKGFIIASRLDNSGYRSELLTIKHLNINDNFNYYNHHLIGSILARRELIELGVDNDFANKVYEYILHHMDLPFEVSNNKTLNKIINKIGKDEIYNLIKLREADKKASNNYKNYLSIHNYNISKIKLLLGG